jgi:exodeoxyribonuclease VII large subunit
MVVLLSVGYFYPRKCVANLAILDRRPHAAIADGLHAPMLDSGGMTKSEDQPPTLASLRARQGKIRALRSQSSPPANEDFEVQPDLFASLEMMELEEDSRQISAGISSPAPAPALPNSKPEATTSVVGMPEFHIWSVRALVFDIRRQVESEYENLWVEGEISNCRTAPSGHVYFTLKDDEAQLPVVLFRRQAGLLRFRPADGLAVLLRGRVSLYESRGQLQLIAETMEPRGAGALQLAFEQLKARLLAEGLFEAERKRPLPAFPKCIGVVTSPAGAVIRDMVTIVRRRHARLNLLVYPATMQGAASPASVAEGIRWFNANLSLVDLIVIARGGGSPEDLAGFNDETLARVIAGSTLPVVSAIGHETDFTIADFAADLRAPTPSAAAELITTAQHRVEERIDALAARMERAGHFRLMHARQRLTRLSAEAVLNRLRDAVSRRDQRLDELRLRLEGFTVRRVRVAAQRHAVLAERLRRRELTGRIAGVQRRLQDLDQSLRVSATGMLAMRQSRLSGTSARLEALSPLAVLSRGYALVYAADGELLRSAAETSEGQMIRARLGHGTVNAEVRSTNENETPATETRTR